MTKIVGTQTQQASCLSNKIIIRKRRACFLLVRTRRAPTVEKHTDLKFGKHKQEIRGS
jgi:hypothetical protein